MRKFNPFSPAKPPVETVPLLPAPSTAVVVRPLRPAIPAVTFERRAFARQEARRLEQTAHRAEPAVREPLAYPTAPLRPAGAARPSFREVSPEEESLNPPYSAYSSRFAPSPMQRPFMRRPGEARVPQNRPEEG